MARHPKFFAFSGLMMTERAPSTASFARRITRYSLKHYFAFADCYPCSHPYFYTPKHRIVASHQRMENPRFLVEMMPTLRRAALLLVVCQQPSMVARAA